MNRTGPMTHAASLVDLANRMETTATELDLAWRPEQFDRLCDLEAIGYRYAAAACRDKAIEPEEPNPEAYLLRVVAFLLIDRSCNK